MGWGSRWKPKNATKLQNRNQNRNRQNRLLLCMQPIVIYYNRKKPEIPTTEKVKPKKQSATEIGLHHQYNRKQSILSRFSVAIYDIEKPKEWKSVFILILAIRCENKLFVSSHNIFCLPVMKCYSMKSCSQMLSLLKRAKIVDLLKILNKIISEMFKNLLKHCDDWSDDDHLHG